MFKSRKKTSHSSRDHRTLRRGGDIHKLHIHVNSPRIVMTQVMSGISKGIKTFLVLSLLGLVAWGGYLGLRHVFIDNEKYKLREIELVTDGHLDHSRVVNEAGIDLNASLFEIKTKDVRTRLINLPEVIDCDVRQHLPGTLKITLKERVPAVWIECAKLNFPGRAQGGVLADKDGITFRCKGTLWQSARDLPVIVIHDTKADAFNHGSPMQHRDATRALRLVELFAERQVRNIWQPERVILRNNYSMEAVCNDGTRAIFGMYEHQRQMDDFLKISEHARLTRREIDHINLIPSKNIPVRFAGAPVNVKPQRTPQTVSQQERKIQSILERP